MTDILKTLVDYGALGLMVGVLLFAINKMAKLMFDDKTRQDKIDTSLVSLTSLIDTVNVNQGLIFQEYKAIIEYERERSKECSERYLAFVTNFDKDVSLRYSESKVVLDSILKAVSVLPKPVLNAD